MINKISVSQSIFKLIGVFEYENGNEKLASLLSKNGFIKEEESKSDQVFLNNYWYPEFRNFLFLSKHENHVSVYRNYTEDSLTVFSISKNFLFKVNFIDIYIFPNEINFFSIDISLETDDLEDYSNFSYNIRKFNTNVIKNGQEKIWIDYIEKNYLCQIKIQSSELNPKVKVDDYSGNKFKVYSIYNCAESVLTNLELLLYDVGSNAKIGTSAGNFEYSPSDEYFKEVMQNKLSVFKNYNILTLFDSFTALGCKFLADDDKYSYYTWTKLYYRIYIYNLFLKYSLFMYNSVFENNPVATRDSFNNFINNYDIKYISFNFLPNEINKKIRQSLDIDGEINHFENRINKISSSIIEEQQNRSNFLLSIVSIIASLSSAKPAYDIACQIQVMLGLSNIAFCSIAILLVIVLGIPLLIYLFPTYSKKNLNKMKKWFQEFHIFTS